MTHEFAFIDWIRRGSAARPGVEVGIGDDCAVLGQECRHRSLLVCHDLLLEGVHFDLEKATPELVGRKALAVNLSDIAAMAGVPCTAYVGLALPRQRGLKFAEAVMRGVQALADEFDVALAGGDTNIWDGPLAVGVTVQGIVSESGPVLRSGARPGDWIMVTGALGGSLESGRHLSFNPKVREAEAIVRLVRVTAMIDLSDGLSRDLKQITESSGVGALIEADRLPIHEDISTTLDHETRVERALSDGEDFELLFTVPPEAGRLLLAEPALPCAVTQVGEILSKPDLIMRKGDGAIKPLVARGWEHRFG